MYFKLNDLFRKNHKLDINFRNEIIKMLCGYETCEDARDTELAWTDEQILNRIQVLVDYRREERIRLSVEPEEVKERVDRWRRWALDNIS